MDKISIVTPSFNQGRFIKTCLQGISQQVGIEIEHIIIDEFSTDNTKEVVEEFQEKNTNPNYKIIFDQKKCGGCHQTINEGVMRTTGDYIAVCNTSDFYLLNIWFITAISNVLNKHKNIDCVWAMSGKVKENDIYNISGVYGQQALTRVCESVYGLKEFKLLKIGFTEVTAIFRAEVLKSLMPQHTGYHPWLDTVIDFYKNGNKSYMFNTVATITREHKGSLTETWGEDIEKKRFKEYVERINTL